MSTLRRLPTPTPSAAEDENDVPTRPLSSVVLPGALTQRVGELLDEWRQSAKLRRYGMQPRNRVLLHGPSGNGKTTLAGAVACELRLPLTLIRYADLVGSRMGEYSRNVAAAFRGPEKRVLFFDECDSLASARFDQVTGGAEWERNAAVNTLLLELDKLPAESVVFFATNLPDSLDPAMRRRINLTLELPAPNVDDLRRLLASIRARNPLWPLDDFDVETCGATSFAALEQIATDHARRAILASDDPLHVAGKPRSHWLRQQFAANFQPSDLDPVSVS